MQLEKELISKEKESKLLQMKIKDNVSPTRNSSPKRLRQVRSAVKYKTTIS
jgi:hypothetical protein